MKTKTTRLEFAEAVGQTQFGKEDVSIREIFGNEELYSNYPKFQRGFIWPKNFQQELVDSILRGCPIHPLLVRIDNSQDDIRYWIIDGQQRMKTVRAFLNGEFKTMGTSREAHGYNDRVEPNRHFQDLSAKSKGIFLGYRFTLNLIEQSVSDEYIELLFRRIQHQKPLVAAEKLAAYTSPVTDMAVSLQDHKLWNIYMGPKSRKETFQAGLWLIALEHANGYTYLQTNHLHEFVAGRKNIRASLRDSLEEHLDIMMHVFDGIKFRLRVAVVIMHQAVVLLEKEGYQFRSSHKGLFTEWLNGLLYVAHANSGVGYFRSTLSDIVSIGRQQSFWEQHLPELIKICDDAEVFKAPQQMRIA
jgi:hypothetical protein